MEGVVDQIYIDQQRVQKIMLWLKAKAQLNQ